MGLAVRLCVACGILVLKMSVKIFVSCCSTPESLGSSRQVAHSLTLSGSLSGTPRTSILIIFWRIFDARFAFHTTPRAAATPRRLWPRATAAAAAAATATVAACWLWRFFRQVGFPSSAVRAAKPLFSLSLTLFPCLCRSCLSRSQA